MRCPVPILVVLSLSAAVLGCPGSDNPCDGIPCDDDCWYELFDDGGSCECVCSSDDDDTGGEACSIAGLPQAVDGAVLANPDVYASIPVRVTVDGVCEGVEVRAGEASAFGEHLGDGRWVTALEIGGLADGTFPLDVTATCEDGSTDGASVELVVAREGVQLTDYDDAGPATTPRIHRSGDGLWLTWVARIEGERAAWMRRIDGAGRWVGDPLRLSPGPDDTYYAFTAFGEQSVAVLYQEPGQPYANRLRILDMAGAERLAPIDLDPPGGTGQPRGDLAFDGEGYVAAYRVADGVGGEEIRWLRVHEQTLEETGPVTVAVAGASDPIGGFEPFVFVKVAALAGRSVVSFVRDRYDDWLEMDLPKTQVATLSADGALLDEQYAGAEAEWAWHWETRVATLPDGFLLLWSVTDLTDPAPDSPTLFRAASFGADGILPQGAGSLLLDAPFDRMDPFLLPHPEHGAVLLWTDLRSYEEIPDTGRIELWAAPVDGELTLGTAAVFPHATFIAGSSELNGALLGSNVMMTWEDERHGSGLADPRPEVYVETAWF